MDRAGSLSPNALLRPVVQDSILPTVAYVGGPAELAYLAQAEVIYRHVLGRMPVPLNRAGFTLLDQRSRKLLDRYKLNLDDFFHGEQVLKERLALAVIPQDLTRTMQESRAAAAQALDRTMESLRSFDVTLAKAAERSQKKVAYQFDKMQKKVAREMLVRDTRAAEHTAYLYGLIYPDRHLQERLYSILPFLARYGTGLIDQIFENVRLDCPEHQLLVI
jgi:uncharacterized protein YllA (UPF0747 family)